MGYRVMYRADMSAADKQAFHQWATDEFEWMDRLHFAQERVRDAEKRAELESHVRSLGALGQASLQASTRGSEDVTVAEKSSSQKARAA